MQLPLTAPGVYAIFVEDLRLDMRLGIYENERTPQAVRLDIVCFVRRLGEGDGYEDVVDYGLLRGTALDLAADRHFGLQETFCEALIGKLRRHRGVCGVIAEARKLTAFADCAGIGIRQMDLDPDILRG